MFSYFKFPLTAILMVQMFSGSDEDSVKSEDKDITKPIVNGTLSYNSFTYKTVIIGTQEWTAENLKTTNYNDETAIPKVTFYRTWINTTSGAYCAYENKESNVDTYGYLYNWYAVNSGKLAPTGWRVPTDEDWDKLMDFVGGESNAGTKLKSKSGWNDFNMVSGNGTDDYGFNALPGGSRFHYDGFFDGLGLYGNWWSSTESNADPAGHLFTGYQLTGAYRGRRSQSCGFSVRLVRDL